MTHTPNFKGQRAVILHRAGDTTDRLARQLTVLGFEVTARWRPLETAAAVDVVFVDADEGWDGLLPWTAGEKPVPLVAVLGSEAPGRITWALDQGADALIAKPVSLSAVYPALVMATRRHAAAQAMAERVAELEERIRLRPLVLRAVQQLMDRQGLGEAEAYRQLRKAAMQQRLSLEQCAATVLTSGQARRA